MPCPQEGEEGFLGRDLAQSAGLASLFSTFVNPSSGTMRFRGAHALVVISGDVYILSCFREIG